LVATKGHPFGILKRRRRISSCRSVIPSGFLIKTSCYASLF
jgi:hypothetical protein